MIRLTQTVRCGGCAAKASASDLARVLSQLPHQVCEQVLVGLETPDDAGVYQIDDHRAIIQTLDFFPPVVDDPYEFGQIAAANSLSDVYAMGGVPITAMNIVCFPTGGEMDLSVLVDILRGGADKVREAGATILGGHTVNDEVIKFGLSVTGIAHPAYITAVKGAQPGDRLVLSKPLGTGLVNTALKAGVAASADVRSAVASMSALNAGAARAMGRTGVHAATDVTGFGLLGHLGEMMGFSGTAARLASSALPILPGAERYAAEGIDTGGARNNAAHLAGRVTFAPGVPEARRRVCFDPQTSGGLLMSVAEAQVESLLTALRHEGTLAAAVIGEVLPGPAGAIHCD